MGVAEVLDADVEFDAGGVDGGEPDACAEGVPRDGGALADGSLETSDVPILSSSHRFGLVEHRAGEALAGVVCLAGGQAVVQLAEHLVEQVPQRGGMPVTMVTATQVVFAARVMASLRL